MNRYFKWSLIGVMTAAFLLLLIPFHSEILLAAVFAFALDPLARYLASRKVIRNSRINFRRKQWVAIILCILFLLIALPIAFAFYNVYGTISQAAGTGFQNTEFFQDLVNLKASIVPRLEEMVESLNLKRQVNLTALAENGLNDIAQRALSWAGGLATQLPDFVLFLLVFVCALYFFLAEHRRIRVALVESGMIEPLELDRVIQIFQKVCSTTILASVLTGLIQAGIVAFGALVLRSGDFFLIFVVTFFLSFVPVIGAAPVALLLCVLSLVKGNYGIAIGFVVVAVIAGSADNLLRPYLASGDDSAHPIVILLSLLGAIVIFGLPGLFLGPVIASATVRLYQVYVLDPRNS